MALLFLAQSARPGRSFPDRRASANLETTPRLSGIVTAQSFVYLKLFPSDTKSLKGLVRLLASSYTLKVLIDICKVLFVWFENLI